MTRPNERTPRLVPKLVGADNELGNLILGGEPGAPTGAEASRALLAEVDGVPGERAPASDPADADPHDGVGDAPARRDNPQDIGRKYLASNGGCCYIDLDHLEICTPETRAATDFVAAWHAMLLIARGALVRANAKLERGRRLVVLVNSSDGRGNSYGSHTNFLITRALWDELFLRRLHPALFVLAAHQVSSIVLTGQGKVGAENGRPPVAYQIAQRADFFERIVGPQTTHWRPICNSRDEPLCGAGGYGTRHAHGDAAGLARLHCIFYDSTLMHVATLLKVGTMQIVLAMLEAGRLGGDLMLDDPLHALLAYSHDPDLGARARLADGRRLGAVELQSAFCEQARRFVDAGECDGVVPDAPRIVALWEDTLDALARRDFARLAPRLDWVAKRLQIERALSARGLDWTAPEAKHLDHLWSNLDADDGLYWALEASDLTEQVAPAAAIEARVHAPPDDTRAWLRAMLLRRLPRERIRRIDWDRIDLEPDAPGDPSPSLRLANPLANRLEPTRAPAAAPARVPIH